MGTEPVEERKSWLAGPLQGAPIEPLLEEIKKDPTVKLLRTVGQNPPLLKVEMTETAVARYRQKFGDAYFFEENAPLHPLDKMG